MRALCLLLVLLIVHGFVVAQVVPDDEARARVFLERGEYRAALDVWDRLAQHYEAQAENDPGALAQVLERLAFTEFRLGDYAKALEHGARAHNLNLQAHGPRGIETAHTYDLLCSLFLRLGDTERAMEFSAKSVRVRLTAFGAQAPETAISYERRGQALAAAGDKTAFEMLAKALRVRLKVFGPTSLEVAPSYDSLGTYFAGLGRGKPEYPERALEFLEKARRLRENLQGLEHPESATTLTSLGLALVNANRSREARDVLDLAWRTRERALGATNLETAATAHNLAGAYLALNERSKAISYYSRSVEGFFATAENTFQMLDNPGKFRFNAANRYRFRALLRAATDTTISGGVTLGEAERRAVFGYWLSFKGSAFSFENGLAPLYGQAAGLKDHIDEYLELRAQLAALYTSTPATEAEAKAVQERAANVARRVAQLERELAGRLSGFKGLLALERINATDLDAQLRSGERYVDYAWFDGSLYAIIAARGGTVDAVNLGETQSLEASVTRLRESINNGDGLDAIKLEARGLYDRLVAPIAKYLDGASNLIVSADGPLHFLPFELLFDGEHFTLERFTIRETPTGRDLLRLRRSNTKVITTPAAGFGNPSFTATNGTAPTVRGLGLEARGLDQRSLANLLRRTAFNPLPYTEVEAKSVAGLLGPETQVFLGDAANEQNLFALRSPKVLHLATHGVFLATGNVPNPLMRVVIALSGARASAVNGDAYGLLTGLQLGSLQLAGTELVTVSACETGLGDEFAGEGVAGLNQVFLTAGARRVMLSLWKVPDKSTATLMEGFYRRWSIGQKPDEALRDAKMTMFLEGLPPRDWAAFILSGD